MKKLGLVIKNNEALRSNGSKLQLFNGKIHYKWSLSIAMLNYQGVRGYHSINMIQFYIYYSNI